MTFVSPQPLMQMLGGVMAARYVMVAVHLDLFSLLAEQPADLEMVAQRIEMPPRTTRILLDALVALQFLYKENAVYGAAPVAQAFLSTQAVSDLRPVVTLWDEIVYPQWLELEHALRNDTNTLGFTDMNSRQQHVFSRGVAALTRASAQALLHAYDFADHQKILDLGGGTGSFLVRILEHAPHLQGALFELPGAIKVLREQRKEINFELFEGDFTTEQIPHGYDLFVLANVIHLFSPEKNQSYLSNIHAAAAPRARLLLVDFWTNPEHTDPMFAALLAGEFQIVTGSGDVYSVEECTRWLEQTGWRFVEHTPLAGAASLIVAEKS